MSICCLWYWDHQRKKGLPSRLPNLGERLPLAKRTPAPNGSRRKKGSQVLSPGRTVAWNVLAEHLPAPVLQRVFNFVDPSLDQNLPGHTNRPLHQDRRVTRPRLLIERPSSSDPYQPSLVFTIGAAGSGKTTWAKATFHEDEVIAADDFFQHKKYEFDKTRLNEAHAWSFDQIAKLLDRHQNAVVNNTNTELTQMYKYAAYVIIKKLPHKIVFAHFNNNDVDLLFRRNQHNVKRKTIQRMLRNIRRMGNPTITKVLKSGPHQPGVSYRNTPIIFTGVFLDKSSNAKLEEALKGKIRFPEQKPIQDLHCTLSFKPLADEDFRAMLRRKTPLRITGIAQNHLVTALSCEILDPEISALCENKYPHVTYAVNEITNPVISNLVLEFGNKDDVIPLDLTLSCYCDGLAKQGWLTDLYPDEEGWQTARAPRKAPSGPRPGQIPNFGRPPPPATKSQHRARQQARSPPRPPPQATPTGETPVTRPAPPPTQQTPVTRPAPPHAHQLRAEAAAFVPSAISTPPQANAKKRQLEKGVFHAVADPDSKRLRRTPVLTPQTSTGAERAAEGNQGGRSPSPLLEEKGKPAVEVEANIFESISFGDGTKKARRKKKDGSYWDGSENAEEELG